MSNELWILLTTAASIGFIHTALGPDHYVPFIAMSRSGRWSLKKTSFVTLLCGIGHILSSVALGFVGVFFGMALSKLKAFESFRGDIATWALIALGLMYFVWGMRRAVKSKPHDHTHAHEDGADHIHTHVHTETHMHLHKKVGAKIFSPWALFIIFILGPCEPLIPMLMYPAAKESIVGLLLVTGVFGFTTILTMLSIVLVSAYGIEFIPMPRLERYAHAIAGAVISLCGFSVLLFGL